MRSVKIETQQVKTTSKIQQETEFLRGLINLKQDKNINIRVNGEMRADFIKAAHDNGKNGTSLIRDFMQRYIDENKSTKPKI